MTYRALTPTEARDIMRQLGYEMSWRSADNNTMGFAKHIEEVLLHCTLDADPSKPGHWTFKFKHMPGVQMLVSLNTDSAQFPHPKFQRFERLVLRFAQACEVVAATAAEHPQPKEYIS